MACASTYGSRPWNPPDYYATEQYAEVGDLRIAFLELGREHERSVVFLHGWSGNVLNFKYQFEALASDHHVLVYDQPGHGKSERDPETEYTLDLFGRTVVGMLDDRGIERATLVGNSAGGRIALWVAEHHPERVEALVLSNTTGSGRDGFVAPVLRTVRPRGLRRLELTTGEHLREQAGPLWDAKREYLASYHGTVEERPYLEMLADSLAPLYAKIDAAALAAFSMPVMLIWSDDDPIVPRRARRYFERHIPGARSEVIEGGGHTPMQAKPGQYTQLVRRFLASPNPPPSERTW